MNRKAAVTPAELEVLRYITDHHPVTVRAVADYFAVKDGRARTTVLTLIERLFRKGFLARRQNEGLYEYSPQAVEAQLTQGLIRSFVQHVLGGDVAPLLQFLGSEASLTPEELAKLRELAGGLTGSAEAAGSDTEEAEQ